MCLVKTVKTLCKFNAYFYVICCCQLARKAYRDVDARLFDKYVEEKAGPVIGTLEQNMYVGMFDWSATYHVTGIWLL